MAEKQAGGLSLRIGLTLNQLQSDFLAAEQTVKQGIAALNRQQNIIRLKMETDTAGLDSLTEKTKILEVQERAITQLLAMQRDKLTLATKAYQDYANSKNANAVVAKNLETSMERERLAVARLEAQLKSLSAQQVIINTTKLQDSIAQLNSKIQHVKIQAEFDVSKLQGANAAFDAQKIHVAAVTKEIELQRQKLVQLQETMYRSAKLNGGDSAQTLTFKTNVLQQIQEIQKLENKLKELQNTKVDLQIRADTFRQAESQIHEKISLLNAKLEHIKVKTDIDLSSLSPMASEFDKAKAHVHNLNQELTLQNQKLTEMKKLLSASISANGLNNVKTINLSTEIQKQIQAIDQLKAKINELNKIEPPKTNGLLNGYLNIKGDVTGKLNSMALAFSNLKGATSSADNAITSVLGVIGEIPHPAARAAATLAGLPIIFKGVENSIIDMTRAAAASGDATYVMSRGFQMSVKDAGKFSTNAKVAGTDVNSLATAIKNVQRQIVRGGDDSRGEKWLRRYGESARNANGDLKNLNEMTFSLSRALHKAQEEGKGAEFIFSVFRNVSADDITAIEDWIAVNEQAATIVKNGLANPALAHEVKGNLNALAVQEGQLKASFESALLPVANEIIPRVTERMGKLTQVIADNKDMIRDFGRTAAEAFMKIEQAAETVGGFIAKVGRVYYDWQKNPRQDEIIERYKNDPNIKTVDDLIKAEQPKAYDVIKANPYLYSQTLGIYQPMFKALQDVQDEIKRKNEELEKLLKQPLSGANASTIGQERRAIEQDSELLETLRRARKYQEEADAILYKMNHSDYENKKLDVDTWYNSLVRESEKSNEELEALAKLRAAKLEQIEKEHNEELARAYEEAERKVKEHYQNAADIEYELTHTAFEKQLRDIERWEELQKRKAESTEEAAAIGAEAVAKEAKAFEDEMDKIKGTLQSLEDKIFEQEHSQYENDLRRIQQERIKLYEDYQSKGILNKDTQALIERYYQNAVGKLNKRADESRKSDGDYTKRPEGAVQSGGNGIMVIEADQIVDDGLIKAQQQQIGLLVEENQIRAQLATKLNEAARLEVEKIQATKELTNAQKNLIQQASGFEVIEGDQVVNQPQSFQQIEGDQLLMPTQELRQFGEALQQTSEQIQQVNPLQEIADAQSAFVDSLKDFPPEYFKNLADNAKAVSEMQGFLTQSTMKLIEAQDKLAQALSDLKVNPSKETSTDGVLKLSTLQVQELQPSPRREFSERSRDTGMKFGFDWDVASGVSGLGLAALKLAQAAGAIAPHPAIKAGALILGAGLGAGAGFGSWQETQAAINQTDERLKAMPSDVDLSPVVTSLSGIGENVQSILQSIQAENEAKFAEYLSVMPKIGDDVQSILQSMQSAKEIPDAPALQQLQMPEPPATLVDYLTPLNNIDGKLQSILQATQTQETISFETVVTPLNSINTLVGNILTALSNRQPPQINIAPNNSIDLGGAYVFDNALKQELVNDITSRIVDEITTAVRQATSQSSYGFSA